MKKLLSEDFSIKPYILVMIMSLGLFLSFILIDYYFGQNSSSIFALILIIHLAFLIHNRIKIRKVQNQNRKEDSLIKYNYLSGQENHNRLGAYLENLLSRYTQEKKKFALLYINIDNFKKIKKQLDHDQGDIILQKIVKRVQKQLRQGDFIARICEDEFIVVIHNFEEELSMALVAKRILASTSSHINSNGYKVNVRLSIGISIFPDDGKSKHELIKNAHIAMYNATVNGPNSFSHYKEDFNIVIQQKFLIEQYLRTAIEKDELFIVFQPKISTVDRKIKGLEALVRWNSYELGSIDPSIFIPIAEENGLIHSISEWIYKESFRQFVKIQKQGNDHLTLSVNVSPIQILENTLEDSLNEAVFQTGIKITSVELEITEGLLLHTSKRTDNILKNLSDEGYKIAIDDFGTGYSSLSYLAEFNIDVLKIDRSFISKISQNSNFSEIVKAIINMANSLNLQTVAEGVETEDQYQILKRFGCDLIQGYYFHKPLQKYELEPLIKQQNMHLVHQESELYG